MEPVGLEYVGGAHPALSLARLNREPTSQVNLRDKTFQEMVNRLAASITVDTGWLVPNPGGTLCSSGSSFWPRCRCVAGGV